MEGLRLPLDLVTNQPNCGVVAVAIAADVPYTVALAAFSRTHGNWKGRTRLSERREALQFFGVYVERKLTEPMTLHSWMQYHAWPSEFYMVTTTGHVQMVHNNLVADQYGLCHIDHYKLRRKRVKHVWRIVKPR